MISDVQKIEKPFEFSSRKWLSVFFKPSKWRTSVEPSFVEKEWERILQWGRKKEGEKEKKSEDRRKRGKRVRMSKKE